MGGINHWSLNGTKGDWEQKSGRSWLTAYQRPFLHLHNGAVITEEIAKLPRIQVIQGTIAILTPSNELT